MQEGNENERTIGLSGYIYRNDCPGAPYIPIYMMVMGASIMLSMTGVSLLLSCDRERSYTCIYFLFISYIAGNLIIFSIHNENISGKLNCDETLNAFACWTAISTFFLLFWWICSRAFSLFEASFSGCCEGQLSYNDAEMAVQE